MTDIPKVITSLNDARANNSGNGVAGTGQRTYTKSPESDRPVMYNTNGFLETSSPPIRGGFIVLDSITNQEEARSGARYASVLTGSFFHGANNLPASVVGPNVSQIIARNDTVSGFTLTWPSISEMSIYLREAFPGLYRPGLCWDTWIMADYGGGVGGSITLAFYSEGTGRTLTTWGRNGLTADSYLLGSSNSSAQQVLIRTSIRNTTPGSEHFDIFILTTGKN